MGIFGGDGVRLQRLVEKGLFPPKEVARWRVVIGDILPFS